MEKHFALIRIGHKLRSLLLFSGCSAIAFESGELIYAYHKEPQDRIKELYWEVSRGDKSEFFHTQDTDFCSSKKPYEFDAGGTGADLLRTRVFSERYGFSVDFRSTRCKFIPKDTDICPGKISACRFIKGKTECYSSGGSTFSLKFPVRTDLKIKE